MTSEDVGLLATLNSDEEVMRHLTGRASSPDESAQELASSLGTRWLLFGRHDGEFLRSLTEAGVWFDTAPPSAHGRVELLRWVREQAVSHTLHRHGRLPDDRSFN